MRICLYMHVHTDTCIYPCTFLYICVYVYICIYIQTQTHTSIAAHSRCLIAISRPTAYFEYQLLPALRIKWDIEQEIKQYASLIQVKDKSC